MAYINEETVHEAGHALVALAGNGYIHYVKVYPGGGEILATGMNEDYERAYYCAGRVAEMLYHNSNTVQPLIYTDAQHFNEKIKNIICPTQRNNAFISACHLAKKILLPRFTTVLNLAQGLGIHKTLNHNQVITLLGA